MLSVDCVGLITRTAVSSDGSNGWELIVMLNRVADIGRTAPTPNGLLVAVVAVVDDTGR